MYLLGSKLVTAPTLSANKDEVRHARIVQNIHIVLQQQTSTSYISLPASNYFLLSKCAR
jgi:hypothetical protein